MGSADFRKAIVGRRAGSLLAHARDGLVRVAARVPPAVASARWRGHDAVAAARDRWTVVRQVWNEARMAGDDREIGPSAAGDAGAPTGELVREGDGVRLRSQVAANRPAFQRWYADPEIALLLRHDQEPLNSVQSRGYFDTIILPLSARGLCFAIHATETDEVIGMSALTEVQTGPGTALFRIVIGEKDLWGRGYGTEATRLVAREAFERLGLRQVKLEVFRHNPRALAAYDRVGFEVTGEHVEWVPRQGIKLEVVEMRLRREAFWQREEERSVPAYSERGAEPSGFSPVDR